MTGSPSDIDSVAYVIWRFQTDRMSHSDIRDQFRTRRWYDYEVVRAYWKQWPRPPAAKHRLLPTGPEVLE